MSSGEDDPRSKALLSDDAIPQIEIPKAAARTPRHFKLPDAIGAAPPRATGIRVPPALGNPVVKIPASSSAESPEEDTASGKNQRPPTKTKF